MPKARGGVADLPKTCGALLKEKNPSLLLAMTDDETPFLAEKADRDRQGRRRHDRRHGVHVAEGRDASTTPTSPC